MEDKRYCFLDIDGVVNTLMIYNEPRGGRGSINRDGYYFELCYPEDKRVSNTQAMTWVSKLCTDYDLSIVITSTWALGKTKEELAECLYNSGLKREVEVIDTVPKNMQYNRGWQIEAWFNEKGMDPDKVVKVILDDDSDMVGFTRDFRKYLVKCQGDVGFRHSDYVFATTILDEQLERLS